MSDYNHYSDQKGWSVDFSCTPQDEAYFQAEFREVATAGRKIVELGFGNGSFLSFARARGAMVFGTEIQQNLVRKAVNAGYPACACLDDLIAEHLDSFDAVVALDVFEHLSHEQIRQTLTTAHNLLKSGGVLIVRAPNGQSPFGRRTQHGDCTHVSVITPKKMEQLCYTTGLDVIKVLNQARVFHTKNPLYGLVKRLQFLARDLCNAAIANIYGMGTTVLDENIVIWIKKTGVRPDLDVSSGEDYSSGRV